MDRPGLPDPSFVLVAEICLLAAALALLLLTDWPRSFVAVQTIPSGATITPAGAPDLRSPAMLPVPADGVRITVSLDGYVPHDTTVVPGSQAMVVYLDYMFRVSVTSNPTGAVVSLDGREAGRTPVTLEIGEAGRHLIEAVSPDLLVLRDTLVLAANAPSNLHFSFPSLAGDGLAFIPGGEFEFQGGPGASLPPRSVRVAPFFIGVNEVSNSEFCSFLNSIDPGALPDPVLGNGRTELLARLFACDYPLDVSAAESGGYFVIAGMEAHPARGMTQAACSLYCSWLTALEDSRRVFRLPSEEEWEFAATTGDGRAWPWGDSEPSGSLLNCSDSCEMIAHRAPGILDGFPETSPSGAFPGNPWGLFDTAGNVWEWCSDWQGGEGAPGFDGPDTIRCLRGGSWLSSPDDCRSATRLGLDAALGYPFAGFRVAATPEMR